MSQSVNYNNPANAGNLDIILLYKGVWVGSLVAKFAIFLLTINWGKSVVKALCSHNLHHKYMRLQNILTNAFIQSPVITQ